MGGHHFGELAKVRGIVVHKISPFEQRAFAGVVEKGIPNTLRRMRGSIFRVVPRECPNLLNVLKRLTNVKNQTFSRNFDVS